jgi:hypothetical protein
LRSQVVDGCLKRIIQFGAIQRSRLDAARGLLQLVARRARSWNSAPRTRWKPHEI